MLPLLADAATAVDPTAVMILADSGDSGVVGLMFPFIAGPAVFAAVYGGIYRYYRNTDKRHHFEKETEVAVGNLRTGDRRRGSNNRQSSRTMSGANQDNHLERVRRIAVR
ncbi:hypothetical protein M4D54_00815 [Brachybacterium sp. p3-SID1565]|uniref:hypothetical protein n=1 Tax=unclassified Brachybacterium TaxID=2623841 RepID=UPI0021AA273E|nr:MULTISPECIES: hypothetical protein [unclassified Brachybacterium]MCT1384185.1 hypothetical protein [Brachybacterium sp. p3-SID1565]MCT1774666.1 hypothetical protein [Brachybacterium sp. p3-SID957]